VGHGAVPDFIEVLENDDLNKPGTVARVQFRVGKKFEPPERVFLGGWPAKAWEERENKKGAKGPMTRWDVPRLSMRAHTFRGEKKPTDPDSAVVLYWDPKALRPGETRKVGFGYGLGSVASEESKGQLLLSVGGRLAIDGEFTLTGLVKDPG